jgi:2-phospho-L-lactate guanylyltransferase
MNGLWALVPVKQLAEAKTRLAGALDATRRRELVLAMAHDVLAALVDAKAFSRVVIVSDIPDIERLIAVDGVSAFDPDPIRGLNEELACSADWAYRQGANHVLIVHADLPTLSAKAVRAFLDPRLNAGSLRIAASKEGTGTNMLLSSLPLPVPLQFGKGSLSRFEAAATRHGVALEIRRDPLLAADIDELADLRELAQAALSDDLRDKATGRWLDIAGIMESLSCLTKHTRSIG